MRRALIIPAVLVAVASACSSGGSGSVEDAMAGAMGLDAECPAVGDTLPDEFAGCLDEETDTFNVAIGVGNDDEPGQCVIWHWEGTGGVEFWAYTGGEVHEGEGPGMMDEDRCTR